MSKAKPYRRKALNEYGERCQACGSTDGVEVHHIDADRQNNKLSNLITLCHDCHRVVLNHTRTLDKSPFEREIESENALLRWLIRQKIWSKANKKMLSEPRPRGCKHPFCDELATPQSKNGNWCFPTCRKQWQRFVSNVQEYTDYPNGF